MSRPIIACDVDCTIVDTGREHWKWLCEETGTTIDKRPFPEGESLPYNLGECFGIPERAMDFWRQEHLYDFLSPVEGCVEALQYASEFYNIIFVSRVKGFHAKSKYYFLKKHFPFFHEAVWTFNKGVVRCNALIDDRVENLNSLTHGETAFLLKTPYKQNVEPKREIIVVESLWEAVECQMRLDGLKTK